MNYKQKILIKIMNYKQKILIKIMNYKQKILIKIMIKTYKKLMNNKWIILVFYNKILEQLQETKKREEYVI